MGVAYGVKAAVLVPSDQWPITALATASLKTGVLEKEATSTTPAVSLLKQGEILKLISLNSKIIDKLT